MFLISLLIFLLVLGFLIFIHELGHFLVAKWTGMRVDEFAIGFPPKLWSWKRGETKYCINAIPFGGYVKIHGEAHQDDETKPDPRSFDQRPLWARLIVMLAGVSMNVIFAFVALVVAFAVGFSSIGQDLTKLPGAQVLEQQVLITGVVADLPAAQAGLQPGDIIDQFTTPDGQQYEVKTVDQLTQYTKQFQDNGILEVEIAYDRNGTKSQVTSQVKADELALGVMIQGLDKVKLPAGQAISAAWKECGLIVQVTWDALKVFGQKLFVHGELDQNVSGPIGVYQVTAAAAQIGFMQVVFVMIVLSLNLALLNLLPLPALDGGKILFLLVETLFPNKVVYRQIENILTTISFVLLIGLMVVLTLRDAFRLF